EPLNMGGFPDFTWTLKGFYEEEFSFTPTNSGWYKILLPDSGKSGARIEFWSPQTHMNVGIDFAREIGGTSLGQLTMLYNDSDNASSTISSVRLADYTTLGSDENSKFGA